MEPRTPQNRICIQHRRTQVFGSLDLEGRNLLMHMLKSLTTGARSLAIDTQASLPKHFCDVHRFEARMVVVLLSAFPG